VWVREKVVAPDGITVIVITECCPSLPVSGGMGENDSFVITSVAAAGELMKREIAARIRITVTPAYAEVIPGEDILFRNLL
jgi:hypothetical protein